MPGAFVDETAIGFTAARHARLAEMSPYTLQAVWGVSVAQEWMATAEFLLCGGIQEKQIDEPGIIRYNYGNTLASRHPRAGGAP